jgi:hypothetical protein
LEFGEAIGGVMNGQVADESELLIDGSFASSKVKTTATESADARQP